MKTTTFLATILSIFIVSGGGAWAQEVIYTEDFSDTPPAGWVFDTNGPANWNPCYTYAGYAYSGTHYLMYQGNYYDPADAWAITQGLELTAGNTYYIDFYQKIASSYYTESMKVTVGSAQTIAGQTTTLLDLPTLNNDTYMYRVSDTFTPTSTGTYYFAFNCYSAAYMYRLFVDLVKVYEIDNSGLANPMPFTASSGHPNIIDLEWSLNASNDPVMIAFNTTATFGTPVDGTVYDPVTNNQIPGGGTVIYKGSALSFQHTGLESQTPYYYKAWSVNSNNYSTGVTTNATTTLIPSIATDFSQGFDANVLPDGWTHGHPTKQWDFVVTDPNGASSSQAGSHFARLDCYHINSYDNPYRLISPPLDLRSGDKQITFWSWIGINAFTPMPIRVEISTDNQATWSTIHTINDYAGTWIFNEISLAGHDHCGSAYLCFAGYSNWGIGYCNLGVDSFDFGHTSSGLEVPQVSINELDGTIMLDWEPIPGANHYRIEASDSPDQGFTELGTTLNTEFSDPSSQKRFYRVVAVE